MRRFSLFLLSLCLLLSFAVFTVSAEDSAVISFGQVQFSNDSTFTVPVTLQNNPGFACAVLTFQYDTTALEITSIKKGGLLTSESGSLTTNCAAGRVAWIDAVNTKGDGELFLLTFSVLNHDTYTDGVISASLSNGSSKNFANSSRSAIPVIFTDSQWPHIHDFDQEAIEAKYLAEAATCTKAAVYYMSCQCGEVGTETFSYGEAPGHTEGNAVTDGNDKVISCSVCGTELSRLMNADKFMARMVLKSDLRFQFGIPTAMRTDWDGVHAVVTKKYADGREDKTVTVAVNECTIVKPYYAIEFTGVSAKEMCDTVVVQLFDAKGNVLSTQKVDSIKDYAERTLRKSSTGAESKTQLVDMLNYGAAAQIEFAYDAENPANSDLTAAEQALATQAVTTVNKLVKGTNYAGSRLLLQSRIELQIGFKNINKTCHAEYSYISHSTGKVKTVQVEGSDFITIGSIVGVAITEPVVADCRNVVTVTVYDANGKVVGSAQDSVESYVNRMSKGGDLFEAIMKFSDSTYATQH